MEQSLTELFNELLALETWLDNETRDKCDSTAFTSQLRSRLDRIKEMKSKVLIQNQKMN